MTTYDKNLRRAARALCDNLRDIDDSDAGDMVTDGLAKDLEKALAAMPLQRPKSREPVNYPDPFESSVVGPIMHLRNAVDKLERETRNQMHGMRNALLVVLEADTCTLDAKAEEQVKMALLGMPE